MGGDISLPCIYHDMGANSRETSLDGDKAKRHDNNLAC